VAFESLADAERFSALAAEEGEEGLEPVPVDAYELFRMVQDVKAAVVLLREGNFMPEPYQLAMAVRGDAPVKVDPAP